MQRLQAVNPGVGPVAEVMARRMTGAKDADCAKLPAAQTAQLRQGFRTWALPGLRDNIRLTPCNASAKHLVMAPGEG